MNWARNPWLGAVLALAALAIHARAQSPLAALAIGLPLALLAWATWCLVPRMKMSASFETAPSSRLSPWVIGFPLLALVVAWFVYICYGLVTGRGVIGWLNAVQAAHDGRFSIKLSFIAAICYPLCAIGVLVGAGEWLGRHRAPSPAPRQGEPAASVAGPKVVVVSGVKSPPPDGTRLALWMFAGMAVAVWVIGYPIHLWTAAQHRDDAQARYVQVVLGAAQPAWPPSQHVALDGVPQGGNVMVLKEGHQARKTYFVPMTGRAWTAGQPVLAVLTFEAEYPPTLDRPVLGRLRSDTLAQVVIDGFARSGVKIDPAHRLIDLVPSEHGKVPDRSDEDLQWFLGLATAVSAMSLVAIPMVWLMMKFKRRRTARRTESARDHAGRPSADRAVLKSRSMSRGKA